MYDVFMCMYYVMETMCAVYINGKYQHTHMHKGKMAH